MEVNGIHVCEENKWIHGGVSVQYITNREEIQAIDRYSIEKIGIPSMVLMERAAMSVVQMVTEYVDELNLGAIHPVCVLIVTEGGNNGGDGLAIARMLADLDYEVTVWQIGGVQHETEQYAAQKHILDQLEIPVLYGCSEDIMQDIRRPRYDVILDAIFGVGLKREITSPQKEVIELLNQAGGLKCAVDIPSGIDSTTGKVLGTAFRADVTVTFGAMKLGHILGDGPAYAGDVLVADIGFPAQTFRENPPQCYSYEIHDLAKLPPRRSDGNKGTFGKVTVIAGSEEICGAAILSATSAYRTGCGLVEVITHVNNREAIQKKLPEALLHVYDSKETAIDLIRKAEAWADVIVIGPGIGLTATSLSLVREVLSGKKPLIFDADAITILSEQPELMKHRIRRVDDGKEHDISEGYERIDDSVIQRLDMVLTPHMKEMERISGIPMGQLKEQPVQSARYLSEQGCICVLKDARTVVTEPGRSDAYINLSGNDGMAVGGSGDVLTGVIAGLYAQGLGLAEAARMGVYIHGLAGDAAAERCGHYSMLAGDIIEGLTEVLHNELFSGGNVHKNGA